jgi:hypothetical protein
MIEGPPAIKRGRAGRWVFWVMAAVVVACLLPLYWFNPVEHSFFPKCIFHALTGLDCPGCGGLRAAHQLLHGHFLNAFKLNPMLICLLPLGAYFGLRQIVFMQTGQLWPQPFKSPRWIMFLAVLVTAFGILRNLPWQRWFAS